MGFPTSITWVCLHETFAISVEEQLLQKPGVFPIEAMLA